MSAQQWTMLALQASLILTVVSFGLTATPRDAGFLFRHPGQLLRTVVSMNVVMPLIAGLIAIWSDVQVSVKVALAALSMAPVPPLVQKGQVASGGRTGYVVGLMVTVSLLAIVIVPVTVEIFDQTVGSRAHVSPLDIAKIVFTSVLIPLALALAARALWPRSERFSTLVGRIAAVLLAISAILLLVAVWPLMRSFIGNGLVVLLALMAAIGLAVGHVLGGPDARDREVLATSTAARHPAVAIAVGSAAPAADIKDVTAIVLLYLLISMVLSAIYRKWQSKRIARSMNG